MEISVLQSISRHLLHVVATLLVSYGWLDESAIPVFIGFGLNGVSLMWYFWTWYRKQKKPIMENEGIENDVMDSNLTVSGGRSSSNL